MGSQLVAVDALRSLPAGSISASYTALGIPFAHPTRLVCLTNNTDSDLLFSFDTTNDNLVVVTGGFKLFDLTTNKNDPDTTFVFRVGTQIYVKGAPTIGAVYLEAIYGQGE